MSIIAIIGHNLDIDFLLKTTRLKGYNKRYKGTRINNKRTLPYSYIGKEITPYNDDLSIEIENTIKYLKRHKDQFLLIKKIKQVEYITLNFYSDSLLKPKSYISHTFYFPADFIGLCGELGISIEYAHYVEVS